MQRLRRTSKFAHRKRLLIPRIPSVQSIDKIFAVFDKCSRLFITAAVFFPIGSIEVFAKIDAILLHVIVHFFERRYLLVHRVSAIINENVYFGNFFFQALQETPVFLRADRDIHSFLFEFFALRIVVDAENFGPLSEIILPHLERSAMRNPDLQNSHILSSETGKMPVINLEVVFALMNQITLVVSEIFLQIITRIV